MSIHWADAGSSLRMAARRLRRSPGFSLLFGAVVAGSLGAGAALLALGRAVLWGPLPFAEADRLVRVWETSPERGRSRNVVNPGNFMNWRESARSFESLAGFAAWKATLSAGAGSDGAVAERVVIGYVTEEFFPTLGVPPRLGRALGPADSREGAGAVVVIAEDLWRRAFGADPGMVGRSILVDGVPKEVVGVMPAALDFPEGVAIWEPWVLGERHRRHAGRFLETVGRLRPGVSAAAAQAEMAAIAARTAVEQPDLNRGWSARVVSLREDAARSLRTGLLALGAAVALLLLVAAANLSGLALGRSLAARREVAVRQALGAGVVRQWVDGLLETVLLGLAGGAAGLFLARGLVAVLPRLLPADLPAFFAARIDGATIVATLAIAAGLGVVAGLPSVLWSTRSAAAPGSSLTTRSGDRRERRWSGALVVAEAAVSLVLLGGGALLLVSWANITAIDPGFRTAGLWVTSIHLPQATYREPGTARTFFTRLEEDLGRAPGVEAVGATTWLPLGGPGSATTIGRATAGAEPLPGDAPVADIRSVSPSFFAAAGVPLVAGRLLDGRDGAAENRRAVVNEALAGQLFPGEDPVGQRLRVSWGSEVEVEIVGVVRDFRLTSLDQDAVRPALFWGMTQEESSFMTVLVRPRPGGAPDHETWRGLVRAIDPGVAAPAFRTMDEVIADSLRGPRFTTFAFLVVGLACVLLAALGVYGVLSAAVERGRKDLGVRLALGGTPSALRAEVIGRALRLAGLGAAIGAGGALLLGRALAGLLRDVAWWDLRALGAAAALVLAVAWVAAALPAWRASRLDPLEALRAE